jgi:hypothetical protein
MAHLHKFHDCDLRHIPLLVIQRRYLPHYTSGGRDIALATVAGVNRKEDERVTRNARHSNHVAAHVSGCVDEIERAITIAQSKDPIGRMSLECGISCGGEVSCCKIKIAYTLVKSR